MSAWQRTLIALVLMAGAFGAVSGVLAEGFWGGVYGGLWGYPWGGYGYSSVNVPTPPYYAVHPPVYYGRRVAVSYGSSPLFRPVWPAGEPVVPVEAAPSSQAERPAVPGKMILNPFVTGK